MHLISTKKSGTAQHVSDNILSSENDMKPITETKVMNSVKKLRMAKLQELTDQIQPELLKHS